MLKKEGSEIKREFDLMKKKEKNKINQAKKERKKERKKESDGKERKKEKDLLKKE